MTDHELKRQLQEKFKFHELDLPADDWNAIEKRLPIPNRRVSTAWWWSVAVGAAAMALVAILLYQQPSNSLPTAPTFAELGQVTTEHSNNKVVDDGNQSSSLFSQVTQTEKSAKDNKKVDTKKKQKQADKDTTSKPNTTEEEKENEKKDSESIETTPKEDENQGPSWHEQEDDGSEYIVQLPKSQQDNMDIAQIDKPENTQKQGVLSIEEAETLMSEQNKQQMEALKENEKK